MNIITSYKVLFGLFLSVAFIYFGHAEPIIIEQTEEEYALFEHMSYLEDPNNSMSIEDIRSLPESVFTEMTFKDQNFGFTKSANWLKLKIYNSTDIVRNRVLSIHYPTLNQVWYYEFVEDSLVREIITGDMKKLSSRDVYTNDFAFYLVLAPKTTYTYYLKVYNHGETMRTPMSLRSLEGYFINEVKKRVGDGLIYGLLFFVIFFNLLLYIVLWEKLHLSYTLYCALFTVFLLIMDGYTFQFFWQESPWLANHTSVFFVAFANIALLYFTQRFLDFKSMSIKIYHFTLGFMALFVLIAFSALFNHPILLWSIKAANVFSGIALIFIIVMSIISLNQGSKLARYFILAFFLLASAVLVYVIRNFNLIPNSFYADYGLKLSFAIEVIILSVAVVDRFKRLRDRTTQELKILVQEKTAEILVQKDEIEKEKEKSEKLLLNILPEKVVTDLKEKGNTEPERFENVTILFSDIVGFTEFASKLDPKDLINELNEKFTVFDGIIEKHNCERLKTIGDGYLAACGMPEENSEHATNIIRAAIEIIDYMKRRARSSQQPMQVRIGIHSGKVVGGIVGIKKYSYDVFGDTVNTASRMESSSEPMRINVSRDTYQILKDEFNFNERGELEVKGKGKMKMYFLADKDYE